MFYSILKELIDLKASNLLNELILTSVDSEL